MKSEDTEALSRIDEYHSRVVNATEFDLKSVFVTETAPRTRQILSTP